MQHTEGLLVAMESLSVEEAKKYFQKEGICKNAIHNVVLNKLFGHLLHFSDWISKDSGCISLGNERSRVEDSIKENPVDGVSVFIERLKEKIAEWYGTSHLRCVSDCGSREEGMRNAREEWQQVFDKNLHRSLDSTYEVFQDVKNLFADSNFCS